MMNAPIVDDQVPEPRLKKPVADGGVPYMRRGMALQAEDVHRPERQVHADEHQPEVPLARASRSALAEDLRPPVVEAGEEPEHGAAEQHVVEVGDDVVGVGLLRVRRGPRRG